MKLRRDELVKCGSVSLSTLEWLLSHEICFAALLSRWDEKGLGALRDEIVGEYIAVRETQEPMRIDGEISQPMGLKVKPNREGRNHLGTKYAPNTDTHWMK